MFKFFSGIYKKYFLWSFLSLFFGFLIPFAVFNFANGAFVFVRSSEPLVYNAPAAVYYATNQTGEQGTVGAQKLDYEKIGVSNFNIPKQGKAVEINLPEMRLHLYKNGTLVAEHDVLSVGKKDSPWETPYGKYTIISREENHFSSIGNVWMPYSSQFFGNFFMHGWPYYADGSPVPEGFSGGCIRLSTESAKHVYEFVENGTPIFITDGVHATEVNKENEFFYFVKNEISFPNTSAKSFLVADLDTGQIVKEKNSDSLYPIASVTKLMTALVSLEAINQYQIANVSENAVNTYGDSGQLEEGEKLLVKQLIYPLLLESSNDAAVALAEHIGEKDFIRLMNNKADSIGLSDIHFDDPSGISSLNVSTAKDVFRLAQYIYKFKGYILNTTQKFEYILENDNEKTTHSWKNNNTFVRNENFIGGKNGYTDEARQTAVVLFSLPLSEFGNRNLGIVVLASEERENDVLSIVEWLKSDIFYGEKIRGIEEEEDGVTSLLFVGDIMFGRGVEKSVLKNAGGDFSSLFEKADFLKGADISFGNLEGPIAAVGEDIGNLYSFRFQPSALDALKNAGFDVVSVANNHAADWGAAAFEENIFRLKNEDIMPVGGGLDIGEASGVKIIEKNGIKFGFLGFSDVGPGWFKAGENKAGILTVDENYASLIKNASQNADVLIVSLHFGDEYEKISNSRQKYLARAAIDNGAKIVIGHHPHVIQEIENYKDGVIAYSLGNFIFDQDFSEETKEGLVLKIDLNENKIIGVTENKIKLNNFYQPELINFHEE